MSIIKEQELLTKLYTYLSETAGGHRVTNLADHDLWSANNPVNLTNIINIIEKHISDNQPKEITEGQEIAFKITQDDNGIQTIDAKCVPALCENEDQFNEMSDQQKQLQNTALIIDVAVMNTLRQVGKEVPLDAKKA